MRAHSALLKQSRNRLARSLKRITFSGLFVVSVCRTGSEYRRLLFVAIGATLVVMMCVQNVAMWVTALTRLVGPGGMLFRLV